MKLCYGSVGNLDGTESKNVVVESKCPVSKSGLLVGVGLIATGVLALIRSAFIKGSDSYGDAYDKALQSVGALDPSFEVNSAENRKYSAYLLKEEES